MSWCLCLSGSVVERQCIKLEILGSNPSLDTNFSLSIYHIRSLTDLLITVVPTAAKFTDVCYFFCAVTVSDAVLVTHLQYLNYSKKIRM